MVGKERLQIAFFGHQAVEYLASLYVLQVGAQVGGDAAVSCYVIGALILVAAAFSGKPFGGGRMSRKAHRFVDIAIIITLAAAPFVFGFSDDGTAGTRLLLLAVALAVLCWFTSYARPQPGVGRDIARGLTQNATRSAGRALGRRLTKRRPPGS